MGLMDSMYACDTSVGKRSYPLREITWLSLSLTCNFETDRLPKNRLYVCGWKTSSGL